jgi:hypothetical protein
MFARQVGGRVVLIKNDVTGCWAIQISLPTGAVMKSIFRFGVKPRALVGRA